MRITLNLIVFSFLFIIVGSVSAQKGGTLRGIIYDEDTGFPIEFATVLIIETDLGTAGDLDGFYSITNIPEGSYKVRYSAVGYSDNELEISISNSRVIEQVAFLKAGVTLDVVEVSANSGFSKTKVEISKIDVSPAQIKSLPSVGGEADIAQYLTVLPGVINTGDQGGQLYIRGGSPIQNKILLDGMTIYNPFHSIGFFSVFETEIIKNVEVYTGGFGADYGGRVSAIVDINTRAGNKKKFSGVVSANPFMAKVLIEGPIKKIDDRGSSISYILTGKGSYIDETSKTLYSYADNAIDTTGGLPYEFRDFYGKLSFNAANGGGANLFGFNYSDGVNYDIASLNWDAIGGGANLRLIPPNSNIIIGARFVGSKYDITLVESDNSPRSSAITDVSGQLDFNYFGNDNEVQWGFNVTTLKTEFEFTNLVQNKITQDNNTAEVAFFIDYRQELGNLVIEPGIRGTLYTKENSEFRIEPRIAAKLNISDNVRLKFAGGLYSQNLVDARNELDIVNLFAGFLSGPEETIFEPDGLTVASKNIQTATHAVAGIEVSLLNKKLNLNIEPYFKDFTQLIELNRSKLEATDPNFVTQTGKALGIDLGATLKVKKIYTFLGYSIGKVTRGEGDDEFVTNFDRRHNFNIVSSYAFGPANVWEAGLRFNYGTGFPFTRTQGNYNQLNFDQGVDTDYITSNGQLGTLFEENRNEGRLPDYARLDLSLKRTFNFSEKTSLELVASVTNTLSRDNIFYFDRLRLDRVDQLPILPSLAATFRF